MCGKNHAHGSWVCRLWFAALPLSAGHFEIQSEIAIASYNIKIVRVFSNHHKKQPALRFLNVQAAFDRKRPSENYFSDSFEIAGNIKFCWVMTQSPLAAGCITAWFRIIW